MGKRGPKTADPAARLFQLGAEITGRRPITIARLATINLCPFCNHTRSAKLDRIDDTVRVTVKLPRACKHRDKCERRMRDVSGTGATA